jgi:hypothetical protein
MNEGKAYPRTCAECGLGPCKFLPQFKNYLSSPVNPIMEDYVDFVALSSPAPTQLPAAPRRFRKKPVVIEAIQYTGNNRCDVVEFLANRCEDYIVPLDGFTSIEKPELHVFGLIYTLEGVMNFVAGDWIIRGVKGEFYPCKPDIFAATYEEENA